MAPVGSDSSPSSPALSDSSPLPKSPVKLDSQPIAPKLAELDEAQSELLDKLKGLKQDVTNWRSKLDTEVKAHKSELSTLKEALNTELEQLRTDFQELRTTLQKQQEDVTASLKNLGLQDEPDHSKKSEIEANKYNLGEGEPYSSVTEIETLQSDGSAAESSL